MTYKALYRFYRPQTFEDVAGQQHIVTTFKNAIKENKIGHAYLLTGPRGTGKTTIAKILAKALNCQEENKPCGQCLVCKGIAEGSYPDVIEIDAASNNGVAEVRGIIERVNFAPIQGKYKVYIIDEVHMMTPEAFNALLKTLEEPPEHAIFILATTEPHKILPTILSRCQRFDFKKVSNEDIMMRLEYILNEEKKEYEKDALLLIAKLADGGMRDALTILEQCLAYKSVLSCQSIYEIYGLVSIEKKITFIKKVISKDIKGVLHSLEEMFSSGIDVKRFTFDMIDILKDIVIYKNTSDDQILFVLNKIDIDSIVPYITVEDCFLFIDSFVEATLQYPSAIDPKVYFEIAILKICNHVKEENITINNEPIKEQPMKQKEVIDVVSEQELIEELEEYYEKPNEDLIEYDPNQIHLEKELHKEDKPVQEVVIEKEQAIAKPIESDHLVEAYVEPNVDKQDVFNILVQANKPVVDEIKEKWEVLPNYFRNVNTTKYAHNLYDAKVVAACNDAFIITFKFKPEVNHVNDSKNYHLLKKFIQDVLGREFDFIALQEDNWVELRSEYVELSKTGGLPKPTPIVLKHIVSLQDLPKKRSKAAQYAVELFGEDIVEIEGEE